MYNKHITTFQRIHIILVKHESINSNLGFKQINYVRGVNLTCHRDFVNYDILRNSKLLIIYLLIFSVAIQFS